MKKSRVVGCILSLIILICIVMIGFRMDAYALENDNVTITLGKYDENTQKVELVQYQVIKSQDDFLFSGEDIAFLTGYKYAINGANATFSRGTKEIVINIEKGILQAPGRITSVKMENGVVSEKGVLYYSGAYLLPWLNVSCFEEAGILYILQDDVSVWDFTQEFNDVAEHMVFDFEACCQELEIESKWLQVGSYVGDKLVSGMVKDAIWIPFSSHSYGKYQDYYAIFEKMFQESDSIVEVYDQVIQCEKQFIALGSLADAGISIQDNIPDKFDLFYRGYEHILELENVLDIIMLWYSVDQNKTEKLMWMDEISGNRLNYAYPDEMLHAVWDISDTYRSNWDGVGINVMQNFADWSIDKLIEKLAGEGLVKEILQRLELWNELIPEWTEGIREIQCYNAIASCGINVYKDSCQHELLYIEDLQQQRAHICLFLYASAQNWSTMADYASDKGFSELSEAYTQKADKAFEWMARFITSAPATTNDSCEYTEGKKKDKYSEELLEIFSKLDIDVVIPNFDVTNINSYLSKLAEYGLTEYSADIPDYKALLEFAFAYIKGEENSKILYEGEYGGYDIIAKKDIDTVLETYFDVVIPEMSIDEFMYQNGKFYRPTADSGEIGFTIAVLDEMKINDDGKCSIAFYEIYVYLQDFNTGENNTTDKADYYRYSMEKIYADRFCEVKRTGQCVLKWENDRYITLEYAFADKSANGSSISEEMVMEFFCSEVPELQQYASYIETNSNSQATLILWKEDDIGEYVDKAGGIHYGYTIIVGENWPDRIVSWNEFCVDKDTSQIFWINGLENEVLYTLDEWRQSVLIGI